jgi:hypothetical protein
MSDSRREVFAWVRKARWLFFAIALLMIAQTPLGIMNAIQLVKQYGHLAFVLPISFAIRLGMIGLFLWLWRSGRQQAKTSPDKQP